MEDCFVCRKQAGLEDLAGGVIYEDEFIFISHAQLFGDEKDHYLGHLFVEPKRHVPELGDLTQEEAAAIGRFVSRVARALEGALGMEHVYAFVIGDHVPHVHVHVIGRYPGAPSEYWGPRVDEWPDAPRGGPAEIEKIARHIRSHLQSPGEEMA